MSTTLDSIVAARQAALERIQPADPTRLSVSVYCDATGPTWSVSYFSGLENLCRPLSGHGKTIEDAIHGCWIEYRHWGRVSAAIARESQRLNDISE
jgi:hypothetical protein